MDDHMHKWAMDYDGAECIHPECGATLNLREIESRLNATSRLSAKEARGYSEASVVMPKFLQNLLSEYADIIEDRS